MRPVVVATILIWVVLISMAASTWNPGEMCKTKYKTPCWKNLGAGWFQMGHRCVKAFKDHMTHSDAEKACKKYKHGSTVGHLVSIHSEQELNQVMCAMWNLQTGKAHYWIGVMMVYDEDGFPYYACLDHTRYNYSHWANRQPDNAWWREHCVEMNYWSWGLWNDANCWIHSPYVCAV